MLGKALPNPTRRRAGLFLLMGLGGWLGVLPAARAQDEPSWDVPRPATERTSERRSAVELAIERHQLPNGLRVVLNPDASAPSVTVCMTYDVGSRNEEPGQSGFAHLFEHLMFQGSRNVEKGQHFTLVTSRGGRMNGTTNKDRTNYFQDLPAHELELGLWLEADRLRSLSLNRANFDNQRAVVLEEFRKNYSNRVYALGRLRLHQLVYQNYWPYEHPVIGFMEDLDRAEYAWAREFHQNYYAPNNAVLSVSGNFAPEHARELIERHFGPALAQPAIPAFREPSRLPRQTSERFNVMVDESAKTPGVYYGWRVPSARTPEFRALELVAEILTGGDSSRLYRTLVIDEAKAQRVSAWLPPQRGPSVFTVFLEIAPLSGVDGAQQHLDTELQRLRAVGPTEAELQKAKQKLRSRWLHQLQTNRERAVRLGEYELFWGDANLLASEVNAYDDVRVSDVRAAAATYLLNQLRSIVEIYPPGWVRDIGPPIVTRTHQVQKGETLIGLARRYGMTPEALAKQNGIKSNAKLQIGQRLLVTVKAGRGERPLRRYTVKKGDTLIGIAKAHKVTAQDIATQNKITIDRALQPGQELTIPHVKKNDGKGDPKTQSGKDAAPPTAPQPPPRKVYTVKPGDTLSAIALRHGTTTRRLAQHNRIQTNHKLRPGQELVIPPKEVEKPEPTPAKPEPGKPTPKPAAPAKPAAPTPAPAKPAAPAPKPERTYTVKQGDTLSGIAHKFGLTSKAIAQRNGLDVKKAIRPGQKLVIPNPQ